VGAGDTLTSTAQTALSCYTIAEHGVPRIYTSVPCQLRKPAIRPTTTPGSRPAANHVEKKMSEPQRRPYFLNDQPTNRSRLFPSKMFPPRCKISLPLVLETWIVLYPGSPQLAHPNYLPELPAGWFQICFRCGQATGPDVFLCICLPLL